MAFSLQRLGLEIWIFPMPPVLGLALTNQVLTAITSKNYDVVMLGLTPLLNQCNIKELRCQQNSAMQFIFFAKKQQDRTDCHTAYYG
jgi:hypothetical protein